MQHHLMISKPPSQQFLVNIVIIVLVCYLILSVEQLRTHQCQSLQHRVSAANRFSHALQLTDSFQPSSHLTSAQQSPPVSENPPPPIPNLRTSTKARHDRPLPECARSNTRAKTYLMVFMGHSGSSALMSEIRQHPQVYFEGSEPVDHQKEFNTTEALQITRRIFDNGIAKGLTPGFKIRPAHILSRPAAWRQLVKDYDTRIIWQYRQNSLKTGVGEYSYRYYNDSSVVEGLRSNITREERCKIGAGCSFRIDDLPFFHHLLCNTVRSSNLIAKAVHEISGGSGCVRELPYEDYLYHREEALTDVQRFLGLEISLNAKVERFKATGDNLCEVVQNWDEICTNFYACPLWQHLFDDPHNNCFCNFSGGPTKFCTLASTN